MAYLTKLSKILTNLTMKLLLRGTIILSFFAALFIALIPQPSQAADDTFSSLDIELSSYRQGPTDVTVRFTIGDENLTPDNNTTTLIELANVLTTISDGGSASVIDYSDATVSLGEDLTDRVEFLSFVTRSQVTFTITDTLLAGETYEFTINDAMIDGSAGGYGVYTFYISNQTSDIDDIDLWLASTSTIVTKNDDYGSKSQMDKPTVKNISAGSATVKWEAAPYQSAVDSFQIRITKKSGATELKRNVSLKKRSKALNDLLGPDTTYYASVRAIYETGDVSVWSTKKKFKTDARQL